MRSPLWAVYYIVVGAWACFAAWFVVLGGRADVPMVARGIFAAVIVVACAFLAVMAALSLHGPRQP